MSRLARLCLTLVLAAIATRARGDGFEADLFHPTDTAEGYYAVDGAFPVRHLGFTAGLFGTWAHKPLVLRTASGAVPDGGNVIGNQLAADVVGSFGVLGRLELGIDLPIALYQVTDDRLAGVAGGIASTQVGDLRIDIKGLLYTLHINERNRIGFTLIAGLTVPSGDQSSFLGQGGVTGRPRAIVEWRGARASAGVSLGVVARASRQLTDLTIGTQVSYGAAGRFVVGHGFEALLELAGLVGVDAPNGPTLAEAPLEILGGGRWRSPLGFEVSLAGGGGLTRGYGAPDGRVVMGFRFATPARVEAPPDADRDGIPDARDKCPEQPGTAANQGCPEIIDSDGDGIVDGLDRCPHKRGVASNGGCPDPDRDGDGIVDRLDKCPDAKGDSQHDGCPNDDRNHDGVPDAADRCPDVPGSVENDGCPDIDSDGDGIVDRLDKCPFDAEVFNGEMDDDGCPDKPAALAEIGEGRIVLLQQPLFDAANELDKRSYKLLSAAAKLITLHPEFLKIRVEGHTDNRGSAIDNLDNSRARAAAVRRFLVERGVQPDRIAAQGYGPDKPIADNRTEAGRAKNRRVDIIVTERRDSTPLP
jgi:outer membrane protein OmpA-like peptidoglycan-associated protein